MKASNKVGAINLSFIAGVIALCAFLLPSPAAQPAAANYYSAQFLDLWPPMPGNALGLFETEVSPGVILLHDENVNYVQLQQEAMLLNMLESVVGDPPAPPGAGEGGGGGSGGGGIGIVLLYLNGNCGGHLLPPSYQGTNLVLTLTNAGSEPYELLTAPYIGITNWTYLGRWTNAANPWTITNPPAFESYYTVGCTNDTDHEGLSDIFEAFVTHSETNNVDTDYDGCSDYEEAYFSPNEATPCEGEVADTIYPNYATNGSVFRPKQLLYLDFNATNYAGSRGQQPMVANNLQLADAWITKGVQLTDGAARLIYQTVETNDWTANLNLRSGSVRFWFKPLWNSGSGPAAGRLLEVGTSGSTGWWSLFFGSQGSQILFASQTNGAAAATNLAAAVTLTSNRWCQIVLTYTNGAVALYTNGVPCLTNTAGFAYPGWEVRTNGFAVGSALAGGSAANGLFEDLETFNYPLTTNEVFENFQLTQPPELIPNLRLWLKANQLTVTNGARIDQWADQSGLNNSVYQIDVATQPTLVTDGINSQPSVRFGGSQYFFIPTATFTNVTQAEALVVLKSTSDPSGSACGLWHIGGSGAASRYPNSDGNLEDGFGTSGTQITGNPVPQLDVAHIYSALSASNRWENRINGVVHFAKNQNSPVFNASSFWLGNGTGNQGQQFDGMMSEVLIYARTLTASQRFAIGRYLGHRFNIVTNPPAIPTNFVAFSVSSNQISLSWKSQLSNTNLSFIVQRRTEGTRFKQVALLENAQSFLDSGLSAASTYYYRVKALNYAGESCETPETSATTFANLASIPLESLKLWVKADSGRGADAVNCWMDQTTNGNHPFHLHSDTLAQPLLSETEMNGHAAISFQGNHAFRFPTFASGWTVGEAFIVLKATGPTQGYYAGLWLLCGGLGQSYYPYTNGAIAENFGRQSGEIISSTPVGALTNAHLYNVLSAPSAWTNWLNNNKLSGLTTNTANFQTSTPRLGWGADAHYFDGYISELLIFDRALAPAERDVVSTNYLRRRFNLW